MSIWNLLNGLLCPITSILSLSLNMVNSVTTCKIFFLILSFLFGGHLEISSTQHITHAKLSSMSIVTSEHICYRRLRCLKIIACIVPSLEQNCKENKDICKETRIFLWLPVYLQLTLTCKICKDIFIWPSD